MVKEKSDIAADRAVSCAAGGHAGPVTIANRKSPGRQATNDFRIL
jgi:hypothetical protein